MSKDAPKVVVSGYYGYDNCGDEAVLLSIVTCLKTLHPGIRIIALSGNPSKTSELYGIEAINRWNPFRIAISLLSSQLLISGGGSLFQDATSTKSLRYYLAIIKMAKMLGKKVMVFSQGIGPLNREKSRAMVSKTLNRCNAITVRDEQSAHLLVDIGITKKIQVTADPAIILETKDISIDIPSELQKTNKNGGEDSLFLVDACYGSSGIMQEPPITGKREHHEKGEKTATNIDCDTSMKTSISQGTHNRSSVPLLTVAIRSWQDDRHLPHVARFLDKRVEEGFSALIIPTHFPNDVHACTRILSMMTQQAHFMNKCFSAWEFIALAAQSDYFFSMRLHGLICAFASGTPILALSYDPKVDAFMTQTGLSEYCIDFDNFDSQIAENLFAKLLSPQPQESITQQETLRENLRKSAWSSAEIAINLLD